MTAKVEIDGKTPKARNVSISYDNKEIALQLKALEVKNGDLIVVRAIEGAHPRAFEIAARAMSEARQILGLKRTATIVLPDGWDIDRIPYKDAVKILQVIKPPRPGEPPP